MTGPTNEIRRLNDALRTTFEGGKIMMTSGVQALGYDIVADALAQLRSFDAFTADNDQHDEHDFASFEMAGRMFFWKIDYYDAAMEFGSEDPSDPERTTRVLTLMLASEY